MANELKGTTEAIDKSASGDKQLGAVYADVLRLYKADVGNGQFQNDLKSVNDELLKNGYLPALEISSVNGTYYKDQAYFQIEKGDKSQLTFDGGQNLTKITYPDGSSRAFEYSDGQIVREDITSKDGKVQSRIQNADGTWFDETGKPITGSDGKAVKMQLNVTADGIFMISEKNSNNETTNFKAINSDGTVSDLKSAPQNDSTASTPDSQNAKTSADTNTISGTDAAALIKGMRPDLLAKLSDSSGLISLDSLKSLDGKDGAYVKPLVDAFSSVSRDGKNIDPDYVLRLQNIELSTTQVSKYNLLMFLKQDPSLSSALANESGISLANVQNCVQDIAKGIDPTTGKADPNYWTPERQDVIRQLVDSAPLLSTDGKVIPKEVLTAGAQSEQKFRDDLSAYLATNPDVKAQLVDATGKISKDKLDTYIKSQGASTNQLLELLNSEFEGISGDGQTVDLPDPTTQKQ